MFYLLLAMAICLLVPWLPVLLPRLEPLRTWSTGQSFRVPDAPEERKRLLALLSQKSGQPVTRAKLIENVPGW